MSKYLTRVTEFAEFVDSHENAVGIRDKCKVVNFHWTSQLSAEPSQKKRGKPKVQHFKACGLRDQIGIMSATAAALRERAAEIFEGSDSSVEYLLKAVNEATELLRKSAGISLWYAENILPKCNAKGNSPLYELHKPFVEVLAGLCLAEAHSIVARSAELRGSSEALVAKLHMGTVRLYEKARSALANTGELKRSTISTIVDTKEGA